MTATDLTRPSVATSPGLGAAVIAVAVAGAAFAIALLAIPPSVAREVWSYPLPTLPFVAGQVFITVHHLILAIGVLVAWRIGLIGSAPLAAVGAVSTSIAMTLLAVVEVVAATAADEVGVTPIVALLGGLYGGASVLLALTSIVCGIAVLRARTWPGITRWTVLVSGIWLLVPLLPAQFDPLFLGRLALAGWSLLYIGLGIGLRRGPAAAGR